jgi:hypothetical protein
MITWLGSGASPPTVPHPGGERPGKRAPLGLSYAKHSRVFACRMKPTEEWVLLNRARHSIIRREYAANTSKRV